jgi:hypothetical protein
MQNQDNNNTEIQLRVIKTARNEQAINKAAEQGFRLLVKPVVPSPEIRVKFAVSQNKLTGKITVAHDFRDRNIDSLIKPVLELPEPTQEEIEEFRRTFPNVQYIEPVVDQETVIGWTYYYPYQFESPFAAYLVPPDIKVGEKVMLEDLIEDVVSHTWNQGDTFRLKSCAAVWGGQDFVIVDEPIGNRVAIIG